MLATGRRIGACGHGGASPARRRAVAAAAAVAAQEIASCAGSPAASPVGRIEQFGVEIGAVARRVPAPCPQPR